MTAAQLRLTMAAMGQPEIQGNGWCQEFGITRQPLYRRLAPDGTLRPDGQKLLARL